MYILMTERKQLFRTGNSNPIYKYETGVDNLQFLIPSTFNGIDMSELECIVQCLLPSNEENKTGLYKLCQYDEDPYNDHIMKVTLPITSTLTKEVGDISLWLLFIKKNEEDDSIANNVLKTSKCLVSVIDNESLDSVSETSFDEIWDHSTIDEIKNEVDTKADSLEIVDDKLVLKSGDKILNVVALQDNVTWKEWK